MMTAFQRIILVAAAVYMIVNIIAVSGDLMYYCYEEEKCRGPEHLVSIIIIKVCHHC